MYNESELFVRNIGLLTDEEQDCLKRAKVAVIGAGGDGGLTIERLVRWGIGNLWIMDPEDFGIENINRQFGADIDSVNNNKAQTVCDITKKINPFLSIKAEAIGISSENVDEIFSWADIVVDEAEYSIPQLAVMIARAGRRHNKFVISGANVGFGATVFSYHPRSDFTLEKLYGINESMPLEEVGQKANPYKGLCPWIPKYGLGIFRKVQAGEISAPMVSSSVAIISAIVSHEVVNFLTGRGRLVFLPKYIWIDLDYHRMKTRRVSNMSFVASYAIAAYEGFRRR